MYRIEKMTKKDFQTPASIRFRAQVNIHVIGHFLRRVKSLSTLVAVESQFTGACVLGLHVPVQIFLRVK